MIFCEKIGTEHTLTHPISYYSKRYGKFIFVEKGYTEKGYSPSNATGVFDIYSAAWWVYCKLCDNGMWVGGDRVTNWCASMVLVDMLRREKIYFSAVYWFVETFLFGGGEARKNGMFLLKRL